MHRKVCVYRFVWLLHSNIWGEDTGELPRCKRTDRKLTQLERTEPDSFQPTELRISAVKHALLTRAESLFTAESVSLTFTEKFSASRSAGLAPYLTTWCGNSSKAISLKLVHICIYINNSADFFQMI